jgi:hypothetical protein
MTSIWWFFAAFIGGTFAGILFFALMISIFALARMSVGLFKRSMKVPDLELNMTR